MKNFKKSVLAILIAGGSLFSGIANSAVLVNTSVDITGTALSDIAGTSGVCAEDMILYGSLKILVISTEDGSGGFHVVLHRQPQGIYAIGNISGITYRGGGAHNYSSNNAADECTIDNTTRSCTLVDNTILTSTDKNWLSVKFTTKQKIVINENGDVKVERATFEKTCGNGSN